MALLVDTLVQGVTALVVVVAMMLLGPDLSIYWASAGKWMTAAAIFLFFCLYWGYFAIFESLWNGQTPGKRQAKIRVISASGRPITVFESIAVDKHNRRLGDMVAGTVVVHEIQEQGDSYWYAQERTSAMSPPAEAIGALTEQEFQLIETFLNRRLDLPNLQRLQSAKDIADRIGAHLKVAPADRPSPEDFLEEVSRRYRDTARFR
jgi:uncharacterized RDD family membrane protein YckC